jgi:hypothetical protein
MRVRGGRGESMRVPVVVAGAELAPGAAAGGQARRGRHGLLWVTVRAGVNGDAHVREQGMSEARESQREGEQSSTHHLNKPAQSVSPRAPLVLLGLAVPHLGPASCHTLPHACWPSPTSSPRLPWSPT